MAYIAPSLLTSANRNDPISVALPKVAKVSTDVSLVLAFLLKLSATNVAYVDEPLYRFLFNRVQFHYAPLDSSYRSNTCPVAYKHIDDIEINFLFILCMIPAYLQS